LPQEAKTRNQGAQNINILLLFSSTALFWVSNQQVVFCALLNGNKNCFFFEKRTLMAGNIKGFTVV
jgi:hypothetical protein